MTDVAPAAAPPRAPPARGASPPPPTVVASALATALGAAAVTSVWEAPDLVGVLPTVLALAYGAAAGALYAALARMPVVRRRPGLLVAYWALAVLPPIFALPSARALAGLPLHWRLLELYFYGSGPRILAYLLGLWGLFAIPCTVVGLAWAAIALRRLARRPRGTRLRYVVGHAAAAAGVGIAAFYAFKMGPPEAVCARIDVPPGVRRVAGNEVWRAVPGLESGRVYDLQVVGEHLVATIKVGADGFGALALLDRQSGTLRDHVRIEAGLEPPAAHPLFPERTAVRGNEVYALVLGSQNRVAHVVVGPGRLEARPGVALPAEGNSILADPDVERFWVFLAAASEKGVLELAGDPPRVARRTTDEELAVGYQYSDVTPDGARIVVSANFAPGLYVVDAETLTLVRRGYRSAIIGVSYGRDGREIYGADPLRRRLVRVDAETLATLGSAPLGTTGLADVDVSPGAVGPAAAGEVVVVGSYTGHLLAFAAPELREIGRAWIGWLLRNVTVDPERREAFAASGCGIYAWDLAPLTTAAEPDRP